MDSGEPPITRSVLQEELDRTLQHYATKANLEELRGDLKLLESRLTMRLGAMIVVATSIIVVAMRFWQ